MRNWNAMLAAALMALSVLAVPASAQADPAEGDAPILEDPAGDVQLSEAGQVAPAPGGRFGPADLVGLTVTETTDTFAFHLTVATLKPDPSEVPVVESGGYNIYFQNNDRVFRISIFRFDFGGTSYFVQLQAFDPGRNGFYTVTASPTDITVIEDVPSSTITTTLLHRDLLTDGNGAAPHPEVPFTGFHVTSRALASSFGLGRGPVANQKAPLPQAFDLMPNQGNGTTSLPIRFGVAQGGQARLSSTSPTRASNGEATTFVFQVTARNLAAHEDRYSLVAVGAPSIFEVKVPADQVTIPGNGTLVFPVLVTTPFTHVHGTFQNFVLEMQSLTDPSSVGRIQLGIRYVQPPQPAGHHPQLWLHSTSPGTDPLTVAQQDAFPGTGADNQAYMNAQDDPEPNDAKVPVPADLDCQEVTTQANFCESGSSGSATPIAHWVWPVPLSPGLELGLDFDEAGKGSNLNAPPFITIRVTNTQPLTGAVLSGRLVHYGPAPKNQFDQFGRPVPGNATVVATLDAVGPLDLPPNNGSPGHEFTTGIHPTPAGDYIPFQRGSSLVLYLYLNTTGPNLPFGPRDSPMLLPGGTLTLPLFEYHDPVSDVFLSSVELLARSKQDRFVNPGKSVLFNVTLMNRGDQEGTFLLELTGTNVAWARMLAPSSSVVLAPGASADFSVEVRVPADAAKGKTADLVVSATNQADFNQRSLLRLFATVDTDHAYPDEAGLADRLASTGSAKSPGFEGVALVALLAGLALLLRRR